MNVGASTRASALRQWVGAVGRLFSGKERHLQSELFVPLPIEHVFEFFSDASNLERITPSDVGFEILTSTPIEMKPGTEIRYRLKVLGIPLNWRTLIPVWRAPHEFVDEQIEGPYKTWIHRHRFERAQGGTIVSDHVRYVLPFGLLGNAVHPIVRRQLTKIFDFRKEAILECLVR